MLKTIFLSISFLCLLFSVEAMAQVTTSRVYEYDENQQLKKVTYSNGSVIDYTYDQVGNRTTRVVTSGCPNNLTVFPSGTVNVCPQQNITLATQLGVGYTYQWYFNNAPMVGRTAVTTGTLPNTSGEYKVLVTRPGCAPSFSTVTTVALVNVNPSISGLAPQYYTGDPVVTLVGHPAGGIFSGLGINGNTFDPTVAGPGVHSIMYSGTFNGCNYVTYAEVEVIRSICEDRTSWRIHKSVLTHFLGTPDVNNDGKNDLIAANQLSGLLHIYLNNGNGFDPTPIVLNVPMYFKPRTGDYGGSVTEHYFQDMNNDGVKDLLLDFSNHYNCTSNNSRIYWGSATYPYFSTGNFTTLETDVYACIRSYAFDFDGNGLKDVLHDQPFGTDRMIKNNGSQNFTLQNTLNFPRDNQFVIDDWNNDGKLDLVGNKNGWADGLWGSYFYPGNGDGTFGTPTINYAAQRPLPHHKIQVDNQPSIIFNAENDGTDRRRLYVGTWNNGANNFVFNTDDRLLPMADIIRIIDYNRDGVDDIIFRQEDYYGYNYLHLIHSTDLGQFTNMRILAISPNYHFVDVVDFGGPCMKALAYSNDSLVVFNLDMDYNILNLREGAMEAIAQHKNDDHPISVYPNPTNGVTTLRFTAQEDGLPISGKVYDALGREVRYFDRYTLQGINLIDLNLENLSSGIYTLQMLIGGIQKEPIKIVIN